MKKKITVRTIVVTSHEGKRMEKDWESLSPEEKERLSKKLTNDFMAGAGYVSKEGIA